MKIDITKKKSYESPIINRIELDNEISLALESFGDPGEPGTIGSLMKAPEHFNNDPFRSNLG